MSADDLTEHRWLSYKKNVGHSFCFFWVVIYVLPSWWSSTYWRGCHEEVEEQSRIFSEQSLIVLHCVVRVFVGVGVCVCVCVSVSFYTFFLCSGTWCSWASIDGRLVIAWFCPGWCDTCCARGRRLKKPKRLPQGTVLDTECMPSKRTGKTWCEPSPATWRTDMWHSPRCQMPRAPFRTKLPRHYFGFRCLQYFSWNFVFKGVELVCTSYNLRMWEVRMWLRGDGVCGRPNQTNCFWRQRRTRTCDITGVGHTWTCQGALPASPERTRTGTPLSRIQCPWQGTERTLFSSDGKGMVIRIGIDMSGKFVGKCLWCGMLHNQRGERNVPFAGRLSRAECVQLVLAWDTMLTTCPWSPKNGDQDGHHSSARPKL